MTKEIIIDEVKQFVNNYNKFPNRDDLSSSRGFSLSSTTIYKMFGGAGELKRQCGWIDLSNAKTNQEFIDYFEALGNKSKDCLEWTLCNDSTDYGRANYKNKEYKIHRLIWKLYNNQEIPNKKVIKHLCNNRKCFNIKHLELGTQSENIIATLTYSKGVTLTETNVRNILKELKTNIQYYDKVTDFDKKFSELYGVKPDSIGYIRRGQTWKHIYKEFFNETN